MHWHRNMNGMIPLWKFNSKALVTVHCIVVALGIFIVCGHLKGTTTVHEPMQGTSMYPRDRR